MSKKVLFLTAIVLVSSACEVQATQISVKWDGGGDGYTWEDANNWDPDIVPDNGVDTFAVTIDAGTSDIDIELQQSYTIDKLDCNGISELTAVFDLWVGTPYPIVLTVDPCDLTNHGILDIDDLLQVAGNMTNYGNLEIQGAEVEGNISNYGTMHLLDEGGVIGDIINIGDAKIFVEDSGIDGNFYNASGAMLKIEHDFDVWDGGLENDGLIVIGLGANLWADRRLHNAGQINLFGASLGGWQSISGEGVIDNNSPGIITGFGIVEVNQLIQNKGTIRASSGSLLLYSEGSVINTGTLQNNPLASLHIKPAEDVNNFGTIEVNAGGGVAFDCNLVNKPNGIIKLLGGTLAATSITQTADANFVGFGGITGDVIIDPNGIISLTGPTNIVGDVTVEHNAVLEISDGQTLIVGHTTNNGEILVVNGKVVFQGGYSGSGRIIYQMKL